MKNQVILKWVIFSAMLLQVEAGFPCYGQQDMNLDSLLKKIELIPVMINGPKDNRINIVIMNRWSANDQDPYNSPEMKDEFLKDINESLIAALTPGDDRAQTAYAHYRQFFNVYGLWWPDTPEWDKGIDLDLVDSLRNRLFLPWKDENTGWVTVLVMPNRNGGGGGAARNLEERVGNALIVGNGIGKMLHEISHTCMSIGDEYTTAATGFSAFPTYNSTMEYRRDKIKWAKWIDPQTPLPTPYTEKYIDKVGAFEGNQYHLAGYFRPTAQGCIMGAGVFDNTEKMCPVCNQRVAMRVYDLVNPVNGYDPSDKEIFINGPETIHFMIDHIRPVPNTQVVRWILNGKTVASGVDSVELTLGGIDEYELVCTLTDETPLIRPDPPYAAYPERKIRWKIHNTRPSPGGEDLHVSVESFKQAGSLSGNDLFKSTVQGGKPPYSFLWSTGDTGRILQNAGPGIYDLLVVDHEYRTAVIHYPVYEEGSPDIWDSLEKETIKTTSSVLNVTPVVTASGKGMDNGCIVLNIKGDRDPYRILWEDQKLTYGDPRIYQAENASVSIPGHTIKEYFGASNEKYLSFKGHSGSVTWKVEVAGEGIYPVDIIYSGVTFDTCRFTISADGNQKLPVPYYSTRPLFTGWDKASVNMNLKKGVNWITLSYSGGSGPNIDYIRIPSCSREIPITSGERMDLKPGQYEVIIKDKTGNAVRQSITVPEAETFTMKDPGIKTSGSKTVTVANPLPGFTYEWYQQDAPVFHREHMEKPLATGNMFSPPQPGNYYLAAKNDRTLAESANRIGFAVGKISGEKSVKPLDPDRLGKNAIVLWFDASDADGDGKTDRDIPARGPLNINEKINPDQRKLFVNYEPNALNGKGIGGFDDVWVQSIGKEAKGFQTIVMVYRESSVSFPGKSPFIGLSGYIGRSAEPDKRLFDPENTDELTKEGTTWLNGKKIDPFTTPNPMDFCILTVELGAVSDLSIQKTEGYWEGSVAEILILNRALSDEERKGIEEYLRRKWFASVDLEF